MVNLDDTVVFVLGTRPEIVKLAPVVQLFGNRARVVYTGQHYDAAMSAIFFAECGLPVPDAQLAIGGRSRGEQIGRGLTEIDHLFRASRPAAVVVQGDTNAGLAGALAANANHIPLVHVEAGLRSFDRRMPEEHNRIAIDHLADVLCAPTNVSAANLHDEMISAERVAITGNTVIEAVARHLPTAEERAKTLAEWGLQSAGYVLTTLHRPENTDDPHTLHALLTEIGRLPAQGWPVVFPVHPRTAAAIERFGFESLVRDVQRIDPVGYHTFLSLAAESALIVSDSGGLQEEVTVLKRPLIVTRRTTERPESLRDFAFLVASGRGLREALETQLGDVSVRHHKLAVCPSPYGDGTASDQIHQLVSAGVQSRQFV